MRVLVDTSVVGGMLGLGKADQATQVAEARILAGADLHDLILPAPALAELLAWLDAGHREVVLARLTAIPRLMVVPFDLAAAQVAAGLAVSKSKDRSHQKVKVDVQVVACGVVAQVMGICTFDEQFVSIASKAKSAIQKVGGPRLFLPPSAFQVQEPIPFAG